MRIPPLMSVKSTLESVLYCPLVCEATRFQNKEDCYINMHRDRSKSRIAGLNLGGSFPINFRWYHNTIHCSEVLSIILNHGDIYIMSELATGVLKDKKTKLFLKHSMGTNGNALR